MRISCRAEKKREAGNCDAHIQAHTWFIVDNRKNQTACPRQVRMSSLALLMDFKWNVSVRYCRTFGLKTVSYTHLTLPTTPYV